MAAESSTQQQRTDLLREAATREIAIVLESLRTSPAGLKEEEAAARLAKYGPNAVAPESHHEWLHRLWVAVRNPPT